MAKLLFAFVLAGFVFQANALDWNPTHWNWNPTHWNWNPIHWNIPNPLKWTSQHLGWISKVDPRNWFGAKCECQLQAETGPCRAAFPRYYYNINKKACEMFTYGGCEGNKNNFENIKKCEKSCKGQ
ncbi:hypothetical protein NPIL_267221 [Nephila pilipes]|uniref:BPTI/Kunitz inhibitor domain-containing protein n=1 Tax=Nephila pilipes TaxID=299642 RepID=A0A8X6MPX0_NEPPI|nr:hypothetical protein NPIL_267221 [Nephila pilipes]